MRKKIPISNKNRAEKNIERKLKTENNRKMKGCFLNHNLILLKILRRFIKKQPKFAAVLTSNTRFLHIKISSLLLVFYFYFIFW